MRSFLYKFLVLIIAIFILFFSYNFTKKNSNQYFDSLSPNELITKRQLKGNKKNEIVKKLFEYEDNFSMHSEIIDLIPKSEFVGNNLHLNKLLITDGFRLGIHNISPGSGFIQSVKNKLFIISSNGLLGYVNMKSNDNNYHIKVIKTNIRSFIHKESHLKHNGISIKDLLIHKDKIYISYVSNNNNCINNSILSGNIDDDFIEFHKFFTPNFCIDPSDADHYGSGGVLEAFDENNILLTVGEHKIRHLAQDLDVINGKILKINLDSVEFNIVSMGHRNPQGLYYDVNEQFIIETEHGPQGGDEINFLRIQENSSDDIPNFGWPLSSYGTFYGGEKNPNFKKLKARYPLHKSHSEFNFVEPIKFFDPSIGIGRIKKISQNIFAIATMVEKSLYLFEFTNKYSEAIFLKKIILKERIRDLDVQDDKLFLYLEDSPSIGILDINSLLNSISDTNKNY